MTMVYTFEENDVLTNTTVASKSKATLEAIARNPRATIRIETGEFVDPSKIDGNGHYRP